MNNKQLLGSLNLPFLIVTVILAVALASVAAMAVSRPAMAKVYPKHSMSVRDDRCYSAAARNNQLSGLFGQSGQGLINAIMNVPIYDWDQGDQIDQRTAAYRAYNIMPMISFISAGLRGPQDGKVLDYAEKFNFTTQMLPSVPWMVQYLGRQLPQDIRNISTVATPSGGMPIHVMGGNPSGRYDDPYIANPFIYMQGAIIDKNGLPKSPLAVNAISGVTDLMNGNGSIESVLGLQSIGNLTNTIKYQSNLLTGNSELINGLTGGAGGLLSTMANMTRQVGSLDISGLENDIRSGKTGEELGTSIDKLNSGTRQLETMAENLLGAVANLPGISHATSMPYSVDGTRADEEDLCYEDMSGATTLLSSVEQAFGGPQSLKGIVPQVPSYAFSMQGSPFGGFGGLGDMSIIPMPGVLYTIYMMADPSTFLLNALNALGINTRLSSNRTSVSGFDFVPGGSINGKEMLDCFGKGVTRTLWAHDQARLGHFEFINPQMVALLLPWNLLSLATMGFVSHPPYTGMSMGDIMMNTAIAAAIRAAGVAADAAGAGGAGKIVADQALQLPAVWMAHEQYYAFVPLFNVNRRSIQLPERYRDRVIAYDDEDDPAPAAATSKTTDINLGAFLLAMTPDKARTLNNSQFNPDVFVKLKEPYVLKPKIEIGANPRQTLDGKELSIDISATKHGFAKGVTTSRVASNVYREDTSRPGGPTFNDSKYGDGRAFTSAKVYKIVLQPGVSPNAIDQFKVKQGTKQYYNSVDAPQINNAVNPCEFFAHQLSVGDGGAEPSARSTERNNANTSIPGVPSIENKPLEDLDGDSKPAFTCGQIADEEVRMRASETEQKLISLPNEKIPAEVAPGTKYCYAVFFDKYTNDLKTQGEKWWSGPNKQNNYNANYSTPADPVFLSRAHCVVSAYKPSLQVRGGDLMVGHDIHTGINSKDYLAGTEGEKRTYGSWAEYGIFAGGDITNMASGGVYRMGLLPTEKDFGYLTFANKRKTDDKPDYGKYTESSTGSRSVLDDGFGKVARQFTAMSGQATQLASPVKLSDLNGVYKINNGAEVTIESGAIAPGRSVVILAGSGSTINIANDITIPTQYQSTADISQVVIAPATGDKYKINIKSNVRQVDAWLINPLGAINTCDIRPDTMAVPYAGPQSMCYQNPLTVNGPVSAGELILRRSGGKDQGDEHTVAQSIPAENFNLRPDSYLWVANYVDNGNRKYVTTNTIDLPPRL